MSLESMRDDLISEADIVVTSNEDGGLEWMKNGTESLELRVEATKEWRCERREGKFTRNHSSVFHHQINHRGRRRHAVGDERGCDDTNVA